MQLTGSIPMEIGKLTGLTWLCVLVYDFTSVPLIVSLQGSAKQLADRTNSINDWATDCAKLLVLFLFTIWCRAHNSAGI